MANYLHAHPGIKDTIHGKIYTIKWLYSKKSDAEKFISKLRKDNMYKEIILHPRIIDGKLFGKHPWMIAVRGRIYGR